MLKFLDTNVLLQGDFEPPFVVSSVSLEELENIKESSKKDEAVKFKARKTISKLNELDGLYEVVIYTKDIRDTYLESLPETPDNKICACAANYKKQDPNLVFITDDLSCRLIAKNIFGLDAVGTQNNEEKYLGYKEVQLTDEDMAHFYEHMSINTYKLNTNEYLILKNESGITVDKFRWNGEYHQKVVDRTVKTTMFGVTKSKDDIQACAIDSIYNNTVTMIRGKAGTGKSHIALSCLFNMLEKNKIEKIIVFCNTVATINSAKLGYYPGTRDEKLRDSSIGNMLSAKFGDRLGLERLLEDEKLVLLPMSDIRGYDTTGMKAGVYIPEAQNMDISLMKLALQRIGEDCVCIIDGDSDTQVDLMFYAGDNNGMKRASQVFRGQDFYGEIELSNIYRSRIAKVADQM